MDRSHTFSQERPAGEWLKKNMNVNDVAFICNQQVPFLYYTERNIVSGGYNETELIRRLEQYHPKYWVIGFYIQDCKDLDNYINLHQDRFVVAQTFNEGEHPAVVILQVLYPEENKPIN